MGSRAALVSASGKAGAAPAKGNGAAGPPRPSFSVLQGVQHGDVPRVLAALVADPPAKAKPAKLHRQLAEYAVKDSAYRLLGPRPGVRPEDLELEARAQMARRCNELEGKLPRYVDKRALEIVQEEGRKREEARRLKSLERIKKLRETLGDARPVGTGAGSTAQGEDQMGKKGKKGKKAGALARTAAQLKAGGARPKKERGRGIGAFCSDLLLRKKSTEEILAAVKKQFPGSKTSPASLAWYRNKLREEGKLPKE